MVYQKPRLVIAALRGGSGKTLVSLGLLAAWRQFGGYRLVPFKKGPDYIDAGWLAHAAGRSCYNLDPFLMSSDAILQSFVQRSFSHDGAVIEGNRGLHDGVDCEGACSTGELAKLLKAPVVLVLDATKVTRTAAALVLGCRQLDPEVNVAAVILNQVAGKRHEKVLKDSIARYCQVPVLGVIPKEAYNFFPERHMGLVPPYEHGKLGEALSFAAEKIRQCIDLEALWKVAETAGPLGWPFRLDASVSGDDTADAVTIGVIRDAAFQFYYPENLEALKAHGANVVELSSLEDESLPEVDALYIGGGFPETHLDRLHNNRGFRRSVRTAAEAGLPIYAECGGLMFLSRGIEHEGQYYPMVGVLPCDVVLGKKPQGHGYTVAKAVRENPFIPKGSVHRGHEFHYSQVMALDPATPMALNLSKGHGVVEGLDGMCYKNTLACYSHLHAVGNDFWAKRMVEAARGYRGGRPVGGDLRRRESGLGLMKALS